MRLVIKHVVMFRFQDNVPQDERQSVLDALALFPQRFPSMRNWVCGVNRSERDDRFSHMFAVEFATEDDLRSYLSSEEHEHFVTERWRPVIAERAIVSIAY